MSDSSKLKDLLVRTLTEEIGRLSSDLAVAHIVIFHQENIENYAEIGRIYVHRCGLEMQLRQALELTDPPDKGNLASLLANKKGMTALDVEYKDLVSQLLNGRLVDLLEEHGFYLHSRLTPEVSQSISRVMCQIDRIKSHLKALNGEKQ